METFTHHTFQRAAESRHKSLTARAFRAAIHGLPGVHIHKPPFPHLLHSNAVPTEAEAFLIKRAITDAHLLYTRLHRILHGSDIRSIWGGRLHLRAITRYNLECTTDFIEEQSAILSPIRKLPPEILEQIFIGTLPPYPMDISTRRYQNADLPWELSQVCQSWRATALSTSILWATIPTVDLGANHTSGHNYLVFLLELFNRSRHVDLHICVDGKVNHDVGPVLNCLVAHSTNWKRVFIRAPFSIIYQLAGVKGRLPELQWLYFIGTIQFVREDFLRGANIDFFQSAPKLKVAHTEGRGWRNVILPYSQLTDYSQENGHEHQLDDLIGNTLPLALQRLSVRNFWESAIPRDVTRRTTISNLTKFEVGFGFATPSFKILDTLVLPALEDLKITCQPGGLIPLVSSLISRSRCSALKKIYLRMKWIAPGDLPALLCNAPTVEHINIPIPPAQDIRYLLYHPAVAPCLRTCGFYTHYILSPDLVEVLRSLAESFCEGTDIDRHAGYDDRRLRSVYLQSPCQFLEENQREIEGWDSTTWASGILSVLKRDFLWDVPELTIGYRPCVGYPETPRRLARWRDPVKNSLFLTEELIVTEAVEIYASGIHLTLRRLSELKNGKYRAAVERIFEKWKRVIEESTEDLRWVIVERDTLVYLSKRNEIRRKVDAFQMIDSCGIRRADIPLDDLPWLN